MNQSEVENMLRAHEARLNTIDVAYAKIETKLNLILGVLTTIGAAMAGVIVKMILV